MSIKWAIPIEVRVNDLKVTKRKRKREGADKTEDNKLMYCLNFKHVFQLKMFIDRRDKIHPITVLKDFPTIGKKRVESCHDCESKSK